MGQTQFLDLVGVAEVSDLILQVERARIGKWRKNGILLSTGERISFPEPIKVLTTAAREKKCTSCRKLYQDRKDECPHCGAKEHKIMVDDTKLAATPLWWGDDIRALADLLVRKKPRN